MKNKFKKTIFFYIPFFSLVLHSAFPWSFKRLAFGIASSKDRHALLLLSESLCLKGCRVELQAMPTFETQGCVSKVVSERLAWPVALVGMA